MRNWLAMTLLVALGLFACTTTNRGSSELSGKVVLDGQTLPANTLVTIVGPTPDTATLGADGTYHFTKLLVGTYAVVVEMPSTVESRLIVEVKVDKDPATAPDITFHPLGSITGVATLGAATGNAGIVVAVAGSSSLAITDDAGHFTLTGVPSGAHDIYATLAGHGSAVKTGVLVPYQASVDAGTLTLTTATSVGAIHGTVTITGAASAAGVNVTLTGPVSQTTTTGADGKYGFTGLPDGAYLITASSSAVGSASRSASVASGNDVTGQDFTFTGQVTHTGSIAGSVAFPGGAVTSVTLTLSGAVSAQTHPAADGTFGFTALPDGAYLLTATAASAAPPSSVLALQVTGGAATTGANFTFLPSTATGAITGTVTLAGATSSAGVVLTLTGPVNASVTSATNGSFAFNSLPNGSYLVTANATSTQPATLARGATVAGGATVTGIDFALVPVGSLKGHITLSTTALGGATVALGGTQLSSVTLADGSYQIDNVPAGSYTVTVLAVGARPGTATATVTRGQQTTTNVDLLPAGGQARLRGIIRVVGQGPVAGVTVTATGATSTGSAVTDAQGNYEIDNLDTGIYTLTADDGHGDTETLGTVLAVPNTDGLFLSNGSLAPLAPLELQHDTRVLSTPGAQIAQVADPTVGKALVLVNPANCQLDNEQEAKAAHHKVGGQGSRVIIGNGQTCLWGLQEVDAVGNPTVITAAGVDEQTVVFAPTSFIPVWVSRQNPDDYYGTLHAYVGGHDLVISTDVQDNGRPDLAFSPDGKTVVYNEGNYNGTLMATDLRTGVQSTLASTQAPRPYVYNVHFISNTRLAYVARDPNTTSDTLYVADTDGSNVVTVITYVYSVLDYDPANTYAVVESYGEGPVLYAATLDGSTQSTISYSNSVTEIRPGHAFLVQDFDVNVLTVDLEVTDGGGSTFFATSETSLTPSGYSQPNFYDVRFTDDHAELAYLAYTDSPGRRDLVTMKTVQGATPNVTALSADSLYSSAFGSQRMVVADQTTGTLVSLGVLSWSSAGQPALSTLEGTPVYNNITRDPAGTELAYQLIDTDGGTPSVLVAQTVNAGGTLVRNALGAQGDNLTTGFSDDGKHLAVLDNAAHTLKVYTFPAATAVALTGLVVDGFDFAPSHRLLVYAEGATHNELYVASDTGASPVRISDNVSEGVNIYGNQVLFGEDYDSVTGTVSATALNLTNLAVTPLVSLAVDGAFLTPNQAIVVREGTAAPYEFQDGVYRPPLP